MADLLFSGGSHTKSRRTALGQPVQLIMDLLRQIAFAASAQTKAEVVADR